MKRKGGHVRSRVYRGKMVGGAEEDVEVTGVSTAADREAIAKAAAIDVEAAAAAAPSPWSPYARAEEGTHEKAVIEHIIANALAAPRQIATADTPTGWKEVHEPSYRGNPTDRGRHAILGLSKESRWPQAYQYSPNAGAQAPGGWSVQGPRWWTPVAAYIQYEGDITSPCAIYLYNNTEDQLQRFDPSPGNTRVNVNLDEVARNTKNMEDHIREGLPYFDPHTLRKYRTNGEEYFD